MTNKIVYDSLGQYNVIKIESHIDKDLSVEYFEQSADRPEFVAISSYDEKTKQQIDVFLKKEALEKLIEKMSMICALRFKNK